MLSFILGEVSGLGNSISKGVTALEDRRQNKRAIEQDLQSDKVTITEYQATNAQDPNLQALTGLAVFMVVLFMLYLLYKNIKTKP